MNHPEDRKTRLELQERKEREKAKRKPKIRQWIKDAIKDQETKDDLRKIERNKGLTGELAILD